MRRKRNEFRFFTSAFVPNFSAPFSRTETFASQRRCPFSMSQVETSMYCSLCFRSGKVRVRFFGAAHVRLADDLDQRRAGPVQVDVGVAIGIAEALMQALAGIIFHVDARDADPFHAAGELNVDVTVLGKRLIRTARSGSPSAGPDRSNFSGPFARRG